MLTAEQKEEYLKIEESHGISQEKFNKKYNFEWLQQDILNKIEQEESDPQQLSLLYDNHESNNIYLPIYYETQTQKDGILYEDELKLRSIAISCILQAGIFLKLPLLTTHTACTIFHRYYTRVSFYKSDFRNICMGAVFLASKVEETIRKTRDIAVVFSQVFKIMCQITRPVVPLQIGSKLFLKYKSIIEDSEREILCELGFEIYNISEKVTPQKYLFNYLIRFRPPNKTQIDKVQKFPILVQRAFGYLNDSIRTTLCIHYPSNIIACSCLYLAIRDIQYSQPKNPWWILFGTSIEHIEEAAGIILQVYTIDQGLKMHDAQKIMSNILKSKNSKRKFPLEFLDGALIETINVEDEERKNNFFSNNNKKKAKSRSRTRSHSNKKKDKKHKSKKHKRDNSYDSAKDKKRSKKDKKKKHRSSRSNSRRKDESKSKINGTDNANKNEIQINSRSPSKSQLSVVQITDQSKISSKSQEKDEQNQQNDLKKDSKEKEYIKESKEKEKIKDSKERDRRRESREKEREKDKIRDSRDKERKSKYDDYSRNDKDRYSKNDSYYDKYDKYGKRYDNKYSSKYDDKYNNKYDDKYSTKYDEKYSSKYDDKYGSKYDDKKSSKYDDKYSSKYDDKYSSKYDDKYNNKYDDKYSSSKYDDKKSSKNDEKSSKYDERSSSKLTDDKKSKYDDKYSSSKTTMNDDEKSNNGLRETDKQDKKKEEKIELSNRIILPSEIKNGKIIDKNKNSPQTLEQVQEEKKKLQNNIKALLEKSKSSQGALQLNTSRSSIIEDSQALQNKNINNIPKMDTEKKRITLESIKRALPSNNKKPELNVVKNNRKESEEETSYEQLMELKRKRQLIKEQNLKKNNE